MVGAAAGGVSAPASPCLPARGQPTRRGLRPRPARPARPVCSAAGTGPGAGSGGPRAPRGRRPPPSDDGQAWFNFSTGGGEASGRGASGSSGSSSAANADADLAILSRLRALGCGDLARRPQEAHFPGSLNESYLFEDVNRRCFFVKINRRFPARELFAGEAAGLRLLADAAARADDGLDWPRPLRVPAVLALGDLPSAPGSDGSNSAGSYLILEGFKLRPFAMLQPGAQAELGAGLAALHAAGAGPGARFGLAEPTRLGLLPLDNTLSDSWPEFFIERRLKDRLGRACARLRALEGETGGSGESAPRPGGPSPGGPGAGPSPAAATQLAAAAAALLPATNEIEDLAPRLLDRAAAILGDMPPPRPAALHGDLWLGASGLAMPPRPAAATAAPGGARSGGILDGPPDGGVTAGADRPDGSAGAGGTIIAYDPAAFVGHSEADLAFRGWTAARGFPGLSDAFYAAYHARLPPAPGFDRRHEIYQLFHLLNHVSIYGREYAPAATELARRVLRD